ncbi:agmatine deiminase family protein [uncultured Paraglaciecola sp.]|uniref:agmatine deiminase family protein n=1 Tax=uncultured Paraglaciecola sp. TaxID=1765024 RepID=UPI0030DC5493|tara:strand:+ start:4908 stop:5960 length:1053 start_codon:yes stop_codon:yes gene_type:complete
MRLLPEWAPQEAVILAWPDQKTDWQPWLQDVRQVYLTIISVLNKANTGVILLIRPEEIATFTSLYQQADLTIDRVLLVRADYNDTWVRDYGFLTCHSSPGMQPVEFNFNGWGNKFNARKDNKINQQVLANLCRLPLQSFDIVAEGGALEIDDAGVLLSTEFCLSNPERNGDMTMMQYRQVFKEALGATSVHIFEQGHLEGDDTDGHIDTLVRFTPNSGLVVQSAFNVPQDSHHDGLAALVAECRAALPEHQIFELPLPNIVNAQGERLPASYANYLINNDQILCPVYQQAEDDLAMQIMAKAYPQYKIVPINCLPLVQQFGSLHCISMQVPVSTLTFEVSNKLATGVSEL